MYLSINWLKEFVKLPKHLSPQELAQKLTLHTVEVEKIEDQAQKFDQVVVGRILEVKKHPNADRLQLATVEVGGRSKLNIVCGASNIAPGQKVPVSMVGAVLPNGLEIKEAEVRGERSQGMLCAPDELGLGDDHSGILILDEKAKVGALFAKHMGLDDQIIEVDNKSLTNRPDLWSHLGMAREIASFMSAKFMPYKGNFKLLEAEKETMQFEVEIDSAKECPRYMAIGLSGIKVAPSPDWMQKRLLAVGLRPINNIVDITNFVMLELGQPMHAFDRAAIDRLVIRQAKPTEEIKTLDGERRLLDQSMLVIADSRKPLAIAGIMGGIESEIRPETSEIIFESANFDFVSIRKTSTKLGLRSESSMRFEKGLDPELAELALIRAIELTLAICPEAKVSSRLFDFRSKKNAEIKEISLSLDWIAGRLGFDIKPERIIEILKSLGFVVRRDKHNLGVTVPSWRAVRDISLPEDILEEVARIYGFNEIVSRQPLVRMSAPDRNPEKILERKIKWLLAGAPALFEVYNYSFVGEEQIRKLGLEPSSHISLANPIASDQTLLRQSLAPNLFVNIRSNQPRYKDFGLFEIGSVYLNVEGEQEKNNSDGEKLLYQEKRLGIVMAGEKPADVFNKLKGVIEYLFASLGLAHDWRVHDIRLAWADYGLAADLYAYDKIIGSLAVIDQKAAKNSGLKREAAVVEISLRRLLEFVNQGYAKHFVEESKFPPLVRDLAFVIPEKILYSELRAAILRFDPMVAEAEIFDVYQGDKLGLGKKSLAFHVRYQADRTLTGEEIDSLQVGLIEALSIKFEARLRDF
jgi:phenylalanyl-tRNA synthetase beta chain